MSYRSEEERQVIFGVAQELFAESRMAYDLPDRLVMECWQSFRNAEALLFRFYGEDDIAFEGLPHVGWRVSQAEAHYTPVQGDILDYIDLLQGIGNPFVLALRDNTIKNWHFHALGIFRGQCGARCLDMLVCLEGQTPVSLSAMLWNELTAEPQGESETKSEAAIDGATPNNGNGKALAATVSGN